MSNFHSGNFFKVYYSENSFETMRVPPDTVVLPNGLVSATATLRNINCQYWPVEVYKRAGEIFFEKGWRKFINENSIEDENVLRFNYVGCSLFDVIVFGPNQCRKSALPVVSEELEMEYPLLDDDEEEEEEEEDEDVDDDDYSQEEDEEEEDEDVDDDDYSEEEEGFELKSEEEKETKEVLDASNNERCQKKINRRNHGCHMGSTSMNDEGTTTMEVDEKELYIRRFVHHLNPYFVAEERQGRQNELHVPITTIKDYDLALERDEKITFIDPHDRKKIGKVGSWTDGRTCIKGWKSICRLNQVNMQHDVCICEFLLQKEQQNDGGGQGTKCIKVHILRGKRTRKT